MKFFMFRFLSKCSLLNILPFLFLFTFSGYTTTAQALKYKAAVVDMQDTFPVPQNIPGMLFYLQRTHNTNTLVYTLNTKADGSINEAEPITVHWKRYQDGAGSQKELNYFQRKFAYGVLYKKIATDVFIINLVAYKKHQLILNRNKADNKFRLLSLINNRYAVLDRVFIRIDPGGTFWKPNVIYIEIKGTDVENGKQLIERIKP